MQLGEEIDKDDPTITTGSESTTTSSSSSSSYSSSSSDGGDASSDFELPPAAAADGPTRDQSAAMQSHHAAQPGGKTRAHHGAMMRPPSESKSSSSSSSYASDEDGGDGRGDDDKSGAHQGKGRAPPQHSIPTGHYSPHPLGAGAGTSMPPTPADLSPIASPRDRLRGADGGGADNDTTAFSIQSDGDGAGAAFFEIESDATTGATSARRQPRHGREEHGRRGNGNAANNTDSRADGTEEIVFGTTGMTRDSSPHNHTMYRPFDEEDGTTAANTNTATSPSAAHHHHHHGRPSPPQPPRMDAQQLGGAKNNNSSNANNSPQRSHQHHTRSSGAPAAGEGEEEGSWQEQGTLSIASNPPSANANQQARTANARPPQPTVLNSTNHGPSVVDDDDGGTNTFTLDESHGTAISASPQQSPQRWRDASTAAVAAAGSYAPLNNSSPAYVGGGAPNSPQHHHAAEEATAASDSEDDDHHGGGGDVVMSVNPADTELSVMAMRGRGGGAADAPIVGLLDSGVVDTREEESTRHLVGEANNDTDAQSQREPASVTSDAAHADNHSDTPASPIPIISAEEHVGGGDDDNSALLSLARDRQQRPQTSRPSSPNWLDGDGDANSASRRRRDDAMFDSAPQSVVVVAAVSSPAVDSEVHSVPSPAIDAEAKADDDLNGDHQSHPPPSRDVDDEGFEDSSSAASSPRGDAVEPASGQEVGGPSPTEEAETRHPAPSKLPSPAHSSSASSSRAASRLEGTDAHDDGASTPQQPAAAETSGEVPVSTAAVKSPAAYRLLDEYDGEVYEDDFSSDASSSASSPAKKGNKRSASPRSRSGSNSLSSSRKSSRFPKAPFSSADPSAVSSRSSSSNNESNNSTHSTTSQSLLISPSSANESSSTAASLLLKSATMGGVSKGVGGRPSPRPQKPVSVGGHAGNAARGHSQQRGAHASGNSSSSATSHPILYGDRNVPPPVVRASVLRHAIKAREHVHAGYKQFSRLSHAAQVLLMAAVTVCDDAEEREKAKVRRTRERRLEAAEMARAVSRGETPSPSRGDGTPNANARESAAGAGRPAVTAMPQYPPISPAASSRPVTATHRNAVMDNNINGGGTPRSSRPTTAGSSRRPQSASLLRPHSSVLPGRPSSSSTNHERHNPSPPRGSSSVGMEELFVYASPMGKPFHPHRPPSAARPTPCEGHRAPTADLDHVGEREEGGAIAEHRANGLEPSRPTTARRSRNLSRAEAGELPPTPLRGGPSSSQISGGGGDGDEDTRDPHVAIVHSPTAPHRPPATRCDGQVSETLSQRINRLSQPKSSCAARPHTAQPQRTHNIADRSDRSRTPRGGHGPSSSSSSPSVFDALYPYAIAPERRRAYEAAAKELEGGEGGSAAERDAGGERQAEKTPRRADGGNAAATPPPTPQQPPQQRRVFSEERTNRLATPKAPAKPPPNELRRNATRFDAEGQEASTQRLYGQGMQAQQNAREAVARRERAHEKALLERNSERGKMKARQREANDGDNDGDVPVTDEAIAARLYTQDVERRQKNHEALEQRLLAAQRGGGGASPRANSHRAPRGKRAPPSDEEIAAGEGAVAAPAAYHFGSPESVARRQHDEPMARREANRNALIDALMTKAAATRVGPSCITPQEWDAIVDRNYANPFPNKGGGARHSEQQPAPPPPTVPQRPTTAPPRPAPKRN